MTADDQLFDYDRPADIEGDGLAAHRVDEYLYGSNHSPNAQVDSDKSHSSSG